MRIFAASDSHFGHLNIRKYEPGRLIWPDVQTMNEMMIVRWNETVMPDDFVFFLGDFAMGQIADTLPIARRLNGRKGLVRGNHDRPFGMMPQTPGNVNDPREKRWKSKVKHAKWYQTYLDVGFEWVVDEIVMEFEGTTIRMNHFPYEGEHDDEVPRYIHLYPEDDGILEVHGHVHSEWLTRISSKGTPMVNVGFDVHDYRPVLLSDAIALAKETVIAV